MRNFKIKIPDSLRMHFNEDTLESIMLVSIKKELVMCDIEFMFTVQYPTRRRAVNALMKYIKDVDINKFNSDTDEIRSLHKNNNRYDINIYGNKDIFLITKV